MFPPRFPPLVDSSKLSKFQDYPPQTKLSCAVPAASGASGPVLWIWYQELVGPEQDLWDFNEIYDNLWRTFIWT